MISHIITAAEEPTEPLFLTYTPQTPSIAKSVYRTFSLTDVNKRACYDGSPAQSNPGRRSGRKSPSLKQLATKHVWKGRPRDDCWPPASWRRAKSVQVWSSSPPPAAARRNDWRHPSQKLVRLPGRRQYKSTTGDVTERDREKVRESPFTLMW